MWTSSLALVTHERIKTLPWEESADASRLKLYVIVPTRLSKSTTTVTFSITTASSFGNAQIYFILRQNDQARFAPHYHFLYAHETTRHVGHPHGELLPVVQQCGFS